MQSNGQTNRKLKQPNSARQLTRKEETHHAGNMQAKAAGRAGRALGLRGALYTAHREGHGPGKAGRSMMVCGVAGVAWQWQHAGHKAGKQNAAGPVAQLARSCSRVRARSFRITRCAGEALSMPSALMATATCSPVLRVVRPHPSRCLCGCACRRAPASKRIARRGSTRARHRDRTKNELCAWSGCREPA